MLGSSECLQVQSHWQLRPPRNYFLAKQDSGWLENNMVRLCTCGQKKHSGQNTEDCSSLTLENFPLAMFCFQTPPLSSELPQEKGDGTPPGMAFEGKQ